jgi:hypothetical protein
MPSQPERQVKLAGALDVAQQQASRLPRLRSQLPGPLNSRSIADPGAPVLAHGGGDLQAALGQRALVLVGILVAAERLRGVELAVAVRADEEAGRLLLRHGGGVEEAEFKVQLLLHLHCAQLVFSRTKHCAKLGFNSTGRSVMRKWRLWSQWTELAHVSVL